MKQKDIALVVVIGLIGAIFSLIVSNSIFSSPKNRNVQVEVVEPITSSFAKPDSRFYNPTAFDPTRVIIIGQNANQDPFSSNTGR
jgi:hypothetical protein